MPRDANGNYTLPAGNPVEPDTTIESQWANTTMPDIGAELTDSLSRSGAGGMLAPFRNADGSAGGPGITWNNEPTTGFYRSALGVMGMSILTTPIGTMEVTGFRMLNGGETNPSYSFTNATQSGMYYTGSALGFAFAGDTKFQIGAAGPEFVANVNINTSGGPQLTLTDGGTRGINADPHMAFADGTGVYGQVGIRNPGTITLDTNMVDTNGSVTTSVGGNIRIRSNISDNLMTRAGNSGRVLQIASVATGAAYIGFNNGIDGTMLGLIGNTDASGGHTVTNGIPAAMALRGDFGLHLVAGSNALFGWTIRNVSSSSFGGFYNTEPHLFVSNQTYGLVVGDGNGAPGVTVFSGSTSRGAVSFADGVNGTEQYRGSVEYEHNTDNLLLRSAGVIHLNVSANGEIISTNNFVAPATFGIRWPSGASIAETSTNLLTFTASNFVYSMGARNLVVTSDGTYVYMTDTANGLGDGFWIRGDSVNEVGIQTNSVMRVNIDNNRTLFTTQYVDISSNAPWIQLSDSRSTAQTTGYLQTWAASGTGTRISQWSLDAYIDNSGNWVEPVGPGFTQWAFRFDQEDMFLQSAEPSTSMSNGSVRMRISRDGRWSNGADNPAGAFRIDQFFDDRYDPGVGFNTYGLYIDSSHTLFTGRGHSTLEVRGGVGTAASGVHDVIASARFHPVDVTLSGGSTVTENSTVRIEGPPTIGALRYSLKVQSGQSIFGGDLHFQAGYSEITQVQESPGATCTLDATVATTHFVTLNATCTFTFVADGIGNRARSMTLLKRQNGTGGWGIIWPGNVLWSGGQEPSLSLAPWSFDILTFITLDGGSSWYGFVGGVLFS